MRTLWYYSTGGEMLKTVKYKIKTYTPNIKQFDK